MGTVTTVPQALDWLTYTYMYRRMRVNPHDYGLLPKDIEVFLQFSFTYPLLKLFFAEGSDATQLLAGKSLHGVETIGRLADGAP